MSKWFKAALIAAMLMPAPVFAQSQDSLAGNWEFRAVFEEIGCVITGEATLTPAAQENRYDVVMIATETCTGQAPNAPVNEHCIAGRTGDRVSIICTLVNLAPGRSYLPDNFELVLRDPNTMIGLLTANWNAPAAWRRRDAAPVS